MPTPLHSVVMPNGFPSPPLAASPLRVMVVDDDARIRDRFQAMLDASTEVELVAAVDCGAAALAALEKFSPQVLLVDLGLPDMSGLEVIKACARAHPHCDIMVISVFGDELHVLQSIEAGATGYLLKDALPEDLIAQIRSLHAGGSPISPVIARQLLNRNRQSSVTSGPPLSEPLSERERTVLELVAKGYTFAEVAKLLQVSPHSVMTYVKRAYRKLQVGSKTEAVYEARKMGLLRE